MLVQGLRTSAPTSYLKPVQTGCEPQADGSLRAPDFDYVAQIEGTRILEYETHVPYRFKLPASPHLSSHLEQKTIYLGPVLKAFDTLAEQAKWVIVEGAGGVHVPLNESENTLDLMKALGLPVIVVTTPRLGTLNHTFLTFEALRARGLSIAGVVFNAFKRNENDLIHQDNAQMIRKNAHPSPFLEIGPDQQINSTIVEFCREITSTA